MKLFVAIALLFPILLIVSACEKNENPVSGCIGDSTTFQLKHGETKRLCSNDSSCVKFVKLISDSRCPSDAVCVWEGTAIIELGTCDAEGGSLNLEIYKPVDYIIDGIKYSAELTMLNPHPDTRHVADFKDYVATITVKRK